MPSFSEVHRLRDRLEGVGGFLPREEVFGGTGWQCRPESLPVEVFREELAMHSRCFPVQIPDSKSDRGLFMFEPIRATRASKEGCRAWNSPQPLEKACFFQVCRSAQGLGEAA